MHVLAFLIVLYLQFFGIRAQYHMYTRLISIVQKFGVFVDVSISYVVVVVVVALFYVLNQFFISLNVVYLGVHKSQRTTSTTSRTTTKTRFT